MAEHFRKGANARIRNADAFGLDVIITDAMDKLFGGTWVGGHVVLTDEVLGFSPNELNRLLHEGELEVEIPVEQIAGADITGGFGTKIIAVELVGGGTFEFRCTKARDVLDQLRAVISD